VQEGVLLHLLDPENVGHRTATTAQVLPTVTV
jgi:hypothetical protein